MKLYNNSKHNLAHGEYKLERGKALEVPKDIANKWLKFEGVTPYAEPKDVKAAEDAKKELETKNAELAARVKELEKALKDSKKAAEDAKEK